MILNKLKNVFSQEIKKQQPIDLYQFISTTETAFNSWKYTKFPISFNERYKYFSLSLLVLTQSLSPSIVQFKYCFSTKPLLLDLN